MYSVNDMENIITSLLDIEGATGWSVYDLLEKLTENAVFSEEEASRLRDYYEQEFE